MYLYRSSSIGSLPNETQGQRPVISIKVKDSNRLRRFDGGPSSIRGSYVVYITNALSKRREVGQ